MRREERGCEAVPGLFRLFGDRMLTNSRISKDAKVVRSIVLSNFCPCGE